MGEKWKLWHILFSWAPKLLDHDCSHEIQRHLLLGRKAMTNLDSVLKSRDITLPTKAYIIKVMVFPVVKYRCKSWAIKKVKCQRIDAFEMWCWRRLKSLGLSAKRWNQSILKEINPEYTLEGLMLKLQSFGHLMQRTDSLEKTVMLGKTESRSGWQRMRWSGGITESVDVNLSKLWETVKNRSLVCCSLRGHKEWDMTQWLNNDNKCFLDKTEVKASLHLILSFWVDFESS